MTHVMRVAPKDTGKHYVGRQGSQGVIIDPTNPGDMFNRNNNKPMTRGGNLRPTQGSRVLDIESHGIMADVRGNHKTKCL